MGATQSDPSMRDVLVQYRQQLIHNITSMDSITDDVIRRDMRSMGYRSLNSHDMRFQWLHLMSRLHVALTSFLETPPLLSRGVHIRPVGEPGAEERQLPLGLSSDDVAQVSNIAAHIMQNMLSVPNTAPVAQPDVPVTDQPITQPDVTVTDENDEPAIAETKTEEQQRTQPESTESKESKESKEQPGLQGLYNANRSIADSLQELMANPAMLGNLIVNPMFQQFQAIGMRALQQHPAMLRQILGQLDNSHPEPLVNAEPSVNAEPRLD